MYESTGIGPSWMDVVGMAQHRLEALSPLRMKMMEVRDRYTGDVVYPWVEGLSGGNEVPDLTPSLMAEAIDNYGMRASEVMPMIFAPTKTNASDLEKRHALTRRRATEALLLANKWPLQMRRMMRHLSAYVSAGALIEPCFRTGMPKIRTVNPLNMFPDPKETEDLTDATNCIYIHGHSMPSLLKMFPQLSASNGGPCDINRDRGEMWNLLRYVDENVQILGLLGKQESHLTDPTFGKNSRELYRTLHRAGGFPGMVVSKVSLDGMANSLASLVGSLDIAAKLQLLDLVATERSIFPDIYIIGDGARTPSLKTSGGQWKDGRTGEVNVIGDAQSIGTLRTTPDPAGARMIDRAERNFRVSTGLASQFGGETTNALRTGRAIDTMLGASVDPKVREMQETVQAYLPNFYQRVLRMTYGYWPSKKYLMVTNWGDDDALVEFVPEKDITENPLIGVKYAAPGSDMQGLTITLGQMLGMGGISLDTWRRQHPGVSDPEKEGRKLAEEELQKAALASIAQGAATMQLPLEDVAVIKDELTKPGADIFSAIIKANEIVERRKQAEAEAAAEEAALAQQQDPMAGMPMDPAMAMAGGPPVPLPGQIGPAPGQEGMRQLMNAMRSANQPVM